MTEREIPDGLGFLFGGMTDDSIPASAPPVLSAPENRLTAAAPFSSAPFTADPFTADPGGAPVYSSRREARAAGVLSADAAAPDLGTPVPEAPAAAIERPAYEGIASLFPLLGEVTLSPLTGALTAPSAFDAILAPPPADSSAAGSAPAAELGATQAIPVADIAVELATPVARYVVPQSAPVAIVPSWHAPEPPVTGRRSAHAAVPAHPSVRLKKASRGADAHRTADAKPLRQRVFGIGVMVLVGGLFAVLAIPAYADNEAATLTAAAVVQTQKVAVANSAASTITTAARDGYTATSAADLKSLYAAAMRQQNIAEYLQSGAKAKGDDYPWFAELSRNQGGGLSPLGYYYRECVDFVAWRLNRDAGTTSAPYRWTWSTLTPNGGDGHQWKAAWLAHGWPTGSTPVPGSVAWFGDNHVGYVNGILDNGQVLIEEYNYVPHAYGTRVINANQAYYLYAPPK
jgi:surface antigen